MNPPAARPATGDIRQRFLFEDYDIRGEIVSLGTTLAEVYARNPYPAALRAHLGEFLAAAALLSANLKTSGTLTVQARGDGPVSLLMAECTDRRDLRAIARRPHPDPLAGDDLRALVGRGHLSVTVAVPGRERHQGIAPLEHPRLAGCLADYFARSEQLPTRLWLAADERAAAGLLLQALPAQRQTPAALRRCWEQLAALADTLTPAEQLALDHETLLYRLFHRERVRLYDPVPMRFACSCSKTRIGNAIAALGPDAVAGLFAATPVIETQCQFCHQHYHFMPAELGAERLGGGVRLH
jgi:molecular chaperone Hsp33